MNGGSAVTSVRTVVVRVRTFSIRVGYPSFLVDKDHPTLFFLDRPIDKDDLLSYS